MRSQKLLETRYWAVVTQLQWLYLLREEPICFGFGPDDTDLSAYHQALASNAELQAIEMGLGYRPQRALAIAKDIDL